MNELINEFVITNEKLRWVNQEKSELESIIIASVLSNNGNIKVYERELHLTEDYNFKLYHNKANRCYEITVERKECQS